MTIADILCPKKSCDEFLSLPQKTERMIRLTTILFMVALLATTSFAAEFRGVLADTIAESFPYSLSSPVISVSAISGDGSMIGGSLTQTGVIFDCATFDCGTTGFVWSHRDSQRWPLGELAISSRTKAFPKSVSALSHDGSTALVSYEYLHYESGLRRDDAVTSLRPEVKIGEWLTGSDMTPNAGVVVGTLGDNPFKWTEEEGLTELSGIVTGSGYGAKAISGDGSTIVLNIAVFGIDLSVNGNGQGRRNAMHWTASDGPSELQPLDGTEYSNAAAISYNGSIVVGSSKANGIVAGSRATMWLDSEPVALEIGGRYSVALDVSADGNSIVGSFDATNPQTDAYFLPEATLWRDGISHRLKDLLVSEYGLGDNIQGWNLTSATAISDNGNVIAGHGISPDGKQSAWVAILAVPEPSSCVLAVMAGLAIASTFIGKLSAKSWR